MKRTHTVIQSMQSTAQKIVDFAISPVKFSLDLYNAREVDNSNANKNKLVGLLTLPFTIPATLFTVQLGALGMVTMMGGSVFALSVTALQDKFSPLSNHQPNDQKVSATQQTKNNVSTVCIVRRFENDPAPIVQQSTPSFEKQDQVVSFAQPKAINSKTVVENESLEKPRQSFSF